MAACIPQFVFQGPGSPSPRNRPTHDPACSYEASSIPRLGPASNTLSTSTSITVVLHYVGWGCRISPYMSAHSKGMLRLLRPFSPVASRRLRLSQYAAPYLRLILQSAPGSCSMEPRKADIEPRRKSQPQLLPPLTRARTGRASARQKSPPAQTPRLHRPLLHSQTTLAHPLPGPHRRPPCCGTPHPWTKWYQHHLLS